MGSILTYNGKILTSGAKRVYQPTNYNPLGLPPYTIRVQFNRYATMPPHNYGQGTLIEVDADHKIWDITTVGNADPGDWHDLVYFFEDVTAVLGANSTGVTDMSGLFRYAPNITSLPLFDTSSVTKMNGMLMNSSIRELPEFDTSSVTDMTLFCWYASRLVRVPNLNLSRVTRMGGAFSHCDWLQELPKFDTSSVVEMGNVCEGEAYLKKVPAWPTESVTDISNAFTNCYRVESGALDFYNKISSQAVPPSKYKYAFANCGRDTVTVAQELAQIPASWGGTGA